MRLWVPGARGLLGHALCKKTTGSFATGREVDIGDERAVNAFVAEHPGITHIVNCAAFSLVDGAETEREAAFRANALGPENLARAADRVGARLIHISTDYVFPGDLRRPLQETDPVLPLNYYGETKREGELRVLRALPNACIIRTSWIFGDGGKNFVAKLLQMLREKEEIRLTDDQWGRPTYAPDLAEAILKMADQQGVYHFANAGVATKFLFGCAMRDQLLALGAPCKSKHLVAVPAAAFPSCCRRPVYSAFDTQKIEPLLPFPIRHWQEALREFLCANAFS